MAIIVFVTCGSPEEAEKIAQLLVENHLAACVNIVNVKSVYEWQGKLERQPEWLLIIKTLDDKFEQLEKLVRVNHSYQAPEILALDIAAVSADYGNWIKSVCLRE